MIGGSRVTILWSLGAASLPLATGSPEIRRGKVSQPPLGREVPSSSWPFGPGSSRVTQGLEFLGCEPP